MTDSKLDWRNNKLLLVPINKYTITIIETIDKAIELTKKDNLDLLKDNKYRSAVFYYTVSLLTDKSDPFWDLTKITHQKVFILLYEQIYDLIDKIIED